MLFPYTYVPHQMEKMQEFIDFIFYEVWCKAPSNEYGIHLFESLPPLYKIIEELYRRDMAGKLKDGAAKDFYESVNYIFNQFNGLSAEEIQGYKLCFNDNNLIKELCSGSVAHSPVTYGKMNPLKIGLNEKLEKFYKNIYSSGFFDLALVEEAIGSNLGTYYTAFIRKNDSGTCPFCGLLPIDSEYDPTREAFDHYLPKSKYPFNCVNLKNLAPSCGKCNSGNKRDQDPLYSTDRRRKAFYPFSDTKVEINLSVHFMEKVWTDLTPEKIEINIQSLAHQEEADTWKELFRIDQRYAAKCCNSNGGRHWLNRIFNEYQNYNITMQQMLQAELKSAQASPWVEANFLKKAFLEGCQRAGLFDSSCKGGAAL